MITVEDLKKNRLFEALTDEMVEKMIPITELIRYKPKASIFKGGEVTDKFYFLKRGKILLEQRLSEKLTVSVGAINPGYSFGWGAMLEEGLYNLDAICAEESEVYVVNGEDLLRLFEEDHTFGYRVLFELMQILKKRLDHRTEQFVRVLKTHPDIQKLLPNTTRLAVTEE